MEDWLGHLRTTDKIILVEGRKDQAALEAVGVRNACALDGPLYEGVEELERRGKPVILLVDLDKEGKKLYHTLKHHLQRHGVKVDTSFREFLFAHTTLTNIEEMEHSLQRHPF